MKGLFTSTVISLFGPVVLLAGLVTCANLSSISASDCREASNSESAYFPGVPTDTTRAPIPYPPTTGNGDSGFIQTPGVFLVFDTPEKDSVRPDFKATEKKEFYWIGFDDTELGTKKATKDRNSRILVERYGSLTPAYEFDRSDGTYVASITKTPLKQRELTAVLYELKPRLNSDTNNFEHIGVASETKPADISDGVGAALQEDMLREFTNAIKTGSNFSVIVLGHKTDQTKSIEKTAKKAAKKIKRNRPAVLFINTHDWLNQGVLNSLEVKGPTEGVTYLVVDRQKKIVGRLEAPAASVDNLVDFFNESIAGAEAQ